MYKRQRYYSPQLGQFISRDPLGHVDGMSQYRAYFVPDGMDPSGSDRTPRPPITLLEFCRTKTIEAEVKGFRISQFDPRKEILGRILSFLQEHAKQKVTLPEFDDGSVSCLSAGYRCCPSSKEVSKQDFKLKSVQYRESQEHFVKLNIVITVKTTIIWGICVRDSCSCEEHPNGLPETTNELEAVENEDVKIPDNSLDTGSILLPPSLLDQ